MPIMKVEFQDFRNPWSVKETPYVDSMKRTDLRKMTSGGSVGTERGHGMQETHARPQRHSAGRPTHRPLSPTAPLSQQLHSRNLLQSNPHIKSMRRPSQTELMLQGAIPKILDVTQVPSHFMRSVNQSRSQGFRSRHTAVSPVVQADETDEKLNKILHLADLHDADVTSDSRAQDRHTTLCSANDKKGGATEPVAHMTSTRLPCVESPLGVSTQLDNVHTCDVYARGYIVNRRREQTLAGPAHKNAVIFTLGDSGYIDDGNGTNIGCVPKEEASRNHVQQSMTGESGDDVMNTCDGIIFV